MAANAWFIYIEGPAHWVWLQHADRRITRVTAEQLDTALALLARAADGGTVKDEARQLMHAIHPTRRRRSIGADIAGPTFEARDAADAEVGLRAIAATLGGVQSVTTAGEQVAFAPGLHIVIADEVAWLFRAGNDGRLASAEAGAWWEA
jgi:hypothetical protein